MAKATETHPQPNSPLDSTTPIVRRLGNRLLHLYDWALEYGPYAHIWDLCCDHGRLGLHLHRQLNGDEGACGTHVHLIDRVPRIIELLSVRYCHVIGANLDVSCSDAGEVTLAEYGRQLLIIAGVGGGTAADILAKLVGPMAALVEREASAGFDIMISPNLHTFELRAFLRNHAFELLDEAFVSEKTHHHEHLLLRYQPDVITARKPSEVGASLWYPLTAEKKRYIQRYIKHYRACVQWADDAQARRAIDAYSALLDATSAG